MKKTLLILFIFIAAGLSCHSPQRILLAERNKTKNTFSILIDTNRLKSLIAEDFEINNAKHNLLVTPSQTLIIENNNMDTGMDAFVSFLKKKYPPNEEFIGYSVTVKYGPDSIVYNKYIMVSTSEPMDLINLRPLTYKLKIIHIMIKKIGSQWWLEARGKYDNKNVAVYYLLDKSGNFLYLTKKSGKNKRVVECKQNFENIDCNPFLTEKFTCACEGVVYPENACSNDICYRYSTALSSYGLGRLFEEKP
ncbi:MAG TPA: hypothetical protein PLG11_09440 [Bacteroidales bacterium]|jgi:hypothetical protein|nr:MAG: hypothetical protein BWX49_00017 [Bacteroidetes bacterium ADurb.Bin008]HNV51200.1 hypothetical protein [Bacteroidales bacterium]HPC70121.1 hypothetical protein [Tenuifilaceae bacterium]HNY45243.1 hypothetical protein [Bacteroidales bacterium]HPI31094.1 hypothetical protein [Bacteroidales bacterium]